MMSRGSERMVQSTSHLCHAGQPSRADCVGKRRQAILGEVKRLYRRIAAPVTETNVRTNKARRRGSTNLFIAAAMATAPSSVI